MATSATAPPLQSVPLLTSKLYDADADLRFMSLNDLQMVFSSPQSSTILSSDYNVCAKVVDGLIHTLHDSNGEVQNLTIKCLGPFVNRIHENILCPMIDRIGQVDIQQSVDKSVRSLALRAVVMSLPRPIIGAPRTKQIYNAYDAVSKVLIPRLIGYAVFPPAEKGLPPVPKGLIVEDLENNADSNAIDVLTEVARCFGSMLRPEEVEALQKITLRVLEDDRIHAGMKKKATTALSALANYFSETMLSVVISNIIDSMKQPHTTLANRKLYINILASMARSIPGKFGPHLRTLAPLVLGSLSQEEVDDQMADTDEEEARDPQQDEVREAALLALEAWLSSCAHDMQRFYDDSLDATLRFLKYDPNFSGEEEEVEEQEEEDEGADEDEEFEMDEDFEEEEGADDDEDFSWKVRQCAARMLNTMVSVRGPDLLDNLSSFNRVIHAVVDRFQEREETVRVEVLNTLSFLIRKIGESDIETSIQLANGVDASLAAPPQGRKRQRSDSDVDMFGGLKARRVTGSTSPGARSPPRNGPPANLAQLSGEIYRGLMKLLNTNSVATKQAVLGVLKDLVATRQGGADDFLPSLIGPVVDIVNGTGVLQVSSSTSGPSVQSQALALLSEFVKTHSSSSLQGHFAQIVPTVAKTAQNKSPRLACDALSTLEQLVKAMTPPRSASTSQKSQTYLVQLFTTVTDIIGSKGADLSVRQQAILVLGTLLGRTASPKAEKLLPAQYRQQGLDSLLETSKNETTRMSSIKAINAIAHQAATKTQFQSAWYGQICLELGGQLRKSDRLLRSASLTALRVLIVRHFSSHNLDPSASQKLNALLLPLFTAEDLVMLGPLLTIYTAMIRGQAFSVEKDLIANLSQLLRSPSAGSVLDPLCTLMNAIGEVGEGKKLMKALLEVGVEGSPSVLGKAIGNLLVSGGKDIGCSTDDFLNELQTTRDDKRKSLALSVLGEAGLRSGSSSGVSPDLFIGYFDQKNSDVSLNAAIALGRAAAGPGNLAKWVPVILSRIQQQPEDSYLALHSIKELLQHNESDLHIIPFAASLWEASILASRSEENRTVGAECVANLTLVDPRKFLPALQSLLSDQFTTIRGTAILAFRDVFTIADASYDKDLRPIIVEVLTTMLRDAEVDNRRSALNTFNAATRNKMPLLLPNMMQLLPLVIDQSIKDPSLMREVTMGPFKHTVDDGLEVRKNAYETIYSIMEIPPARLEIPQIYDRVVAGVNDDRGIQTLCNLMVTKLAVSAPDETVRRLNELAAQFSVILAFKPKENSVRHEFEKADESKKGAVKVALELQKLFPGEASSKDKWSSFLDEMKKCNDGALLKEVEKEVRLQANS